MSYVAHSASAASTDAVWQSKLPAGWRPIRLKYLCERSAIYGANISAEHYVDDGVRFLRTSDIDDAGHLLPEGVLVHPADAKEYLLNDGDVLLSRSGTLGRAFVYRSSQHPVAGYAGYLVRFVPGRTLNPQFLFYFTKSKTFDGWLETEAIASTIGNVNGQKYADCPLPCPSLREQRAIADFLDAQTARIDALVAKKRELIEKLKEKRAALISRTVTSGLPPEAARAAGLDPHPRLKPSGVEWLGDVPEHWEISKLKFASKKISKGTTPSTIDKEMANEGIRFIKAENIVDGTISQTPAFFIDEETDSLLSRSRLEANDILVVIAGATTGKSAVLSEALLPANTNQAVCFIRLREPERASGIAMWLGTGFIQDLVWNVAVQAAQPNIAMGDISTFPLLVPPLVEARAISKFLGRESAVIDRMIGLAEDAIHLLQEYRTALITAAVTGKIDVRRVVVESQVAPEAAA